MVTGPPSSSSRSGGPRASTELRPRASILVVAILVCLLALWSPLWLPSQALADVARLTPADLDGSPLLNGDLTLTWTVYEGNTANNRWGTLTWTGTAFALASALYAVGMTVGPRWTSRLSAVLIGVLGLTAIAAGLLFDEIGSGLMGLGLAGAAAWLRRVARP